MRVFVLGAGVAGLSAAYHLKKKGISPRVLEKDSDWGGLCGNFSLEGFRFDKFVHFSFTENSYVREIFEKNIEVLKHFPRAYNYYNGKWLKHPAQNNLFPLEEEEKQKIIKDFKNRKNKKVEEIENLEEWFRVQFGDYFAENFPMVYTEKYWTVPAKEMGTKWVGQRMYKPTLKEVNEGARTRNTPNTYYANEMRYPQKGGFKSFFQEFTGDLDISFNSKITRINTEEKFIVINGEEKLPYDYLLSSIPLPEYLSLVDNIPGKVKKALQNLQFTSGYLISLGFQGNNIPPYLWFYIYDREILPARVHSPSLKSPDNCPGGCSSLQLEIYFSKRGPINKKPDKIMEETIDKVDAAGIFQKKDILVRDIRKVDYANVVFGHDIYENRKIAIEFLKEKGIEGIGRFGEWDYLWSDQSFLSGKKGAENLIFLS